MTDLPDNAGRHKAPPLSNGRMADIRRMARRAAALDATADLDPEDIETPGLAEVVDCLRHIDEAKTGHTFRSAQRDTWPAPLTELRAAFDSGRKVRGETDEEQDGPCRVCSL